MYNQVGWMLRVSNKTMLRIFHKNPSRLETITKLNIGIRNLLRTYVGTLRYRNHRFSHETLRSHIDNLMSLTQFCETHIILHNYLQINLGRWFWLGIYSNCPVLVRCIFLSIRVLKTYLYLVITIILRSWGGWRLTFSRM